jgi:hypothetical protein
MFDASAESIPDRLLAEGKKRDKQPIILKRQKIARSR